MQDEPRNNSFLTPVRHAAWMILVSITRFSYRNSAGRVAFAKMPPPVAAARKTTSIFLSAIHSSTAAWRNRSRSLRAAVTISQLSRARHRTIADPAMPRCPATQTRRPFNSKLVMTNPSHAGFSGDSFQIRVQHIGDQFGKRDRVLPSQNPVLLGSVAQEQVDLSWPEIAAVDLHQQDAAGGIDAHLVNSLALPFDLAAHLQEGQFYVLAHAMRFTRRQDVIVRRILLHNPPHAFHVVSRMAPVALGVQIPDIEPILHAQVNSGHRASYLPCDEGLAADGALVIEQNAVRGMHGVCLPVVYRNPVSIELGNAIGAARIKGRGFRLWSLDRKGVV